jgi:uncharacterized SAM-binding protein YcdF (DUF218 family)
MFFLLSKLLEFLIIPLVWVLVLLLFAIFHKSPKRRKVFLIIAAAVFFFFTNNFIADEFMRMWEVPAVSFKSVTKKYDVGIVLGGMLSYDQKLQRVQFDRGSDRIFQALKLYKEGKIKRILIDGGSGSLTEKDILEAPILREYLLEIGIPDSVICTEARSRNTHENAVFVKPILDSVAPHGSYLLITSASHMRRAMRCFEKVGITVTPFSTDRYSGPRKFLLDHMLIPDKWALLSWDLLIHEWVGFITYKIAGYI